MVIQPQLFFYQHFYDEIQEKIKLKRNKKPSMIEHTSDCHSYLSILHVEIIPANMSAGK